MRLPWGLRWWEFVPEVALGAALAVFLATETSAATSAFASRTAVVMMGAAAVGWAAGRLVLVRVAPWPVLRLAVFAVAALAVVRVVVLPAYDDTTVVETLAAAPAPAPGGPAAPATPAAPASPAAEGVPGASVTQPPMSAPATTASPAGGGGPVALRSSAIRGIDHRASGTTVLYRQADGSLVVGLEGIDIQPGPDYDLYVVPGRDRDDPGGGRRLGDLRGNKGTQYYPVPAGTGVDGGPWTVLVWCETFDVPIAAATLA